MSISVSRPVYPDAKANAAAAAAAAQALQHGAAASTGVQAGLMGTRAVRTQSDDTDQYPMRAEDGDGDSSDDGAVLAATDHKTSVVASAAEPPSLPPFNAPTPPLRTSANGSTNPDSLTGASHASSAALSRGQTAPVTVSTVDGARTQGSSADISEARFVVMPFTAPVFMRSNTDCAAHILNGYSSPSLL